ncbi:2-C-methyl-D-erythritol 4-phosphate cytidylyltransferase [Tuberibacillus sp. Marseille-P3662]|uniref:2-C-methyl-D-erythritol 4-phosphate cytidylyltransferase n=1 Tax=Tuberibacillus sp. Marseille-P3662 TaxID=1965358 RepID=UPI000A1C983E|nr:2-C-methyl-D-erythritol 4-phosphate cytidylyltransferase [Tuberibacillus sp. Marseille-P3662]
MGYQVILPAAGSGSRMGASSNKIFLELLGAPLIVHTLKVFEHDSQCNSIILAIKEEEQSIFETLIRDHHLTKVRQFIHGGSERQHSVYNALKATSEEAIVLIHDAARPMIHQQLIEKVYTAAVQEGAAVLAVPVKDTIKKVCDGFVDKTLDRSDLWAVQTPQAFHRSWILSAHEAAAKQGWAVTDDASLIEQMGGKVTIVKGDDRNLKVTTPEDLWVAEHFMQIRNG